MRAEFFACLLLCLAASSLQPLAAADPGAMQTAQQRFDEGDFAQAADLFEKAAAGSPASAELYYNLGRAYLKLDNPARAALNFRKALVLAPSFAAARQALKECEEDLALPRRQPDWKDRVAEALPFDMAAVASVVLFWTAAGLLLSIVFGRKRLWKTGLALTGVAAAAGLGFVAWQADPRVRASDEATVLASGGAVLLEAPTESATKVAALPEGATVDIHSQRGRWFYGSTPSGASGWFSTEGIVPTIPAP